MIYNKYVNIFKEYLLKYIKKFEEIKIIFYVVFFIFYFFFYYAITISDTISEIKDNPIKDIFTSKNILFITIFSVVNAIYIGITIFLLMKYKSKNIYIATLIPIMLSGIVMFFNVVIISKYIKFMSELKIFKYIFIGVSHIFNIIFFLAFMFNITNELNIEFFIALEILFIFLLKNIIKSSINMNRIYYLLKNNDYSILTINCFNQTNIENYQSKNQPDDNYLKTIGNIPISFYNKNINDYQDLILADFYYPGSYYSYLADSPLYGTPSLESLKIVLSKFKVRIIHLDIFSDKSDPYDQSANPVVRCETMSDGALPLNFEECLGLINKWAWSDDHSYPFFLYLNFNFEQDNQNIYLKIYNSLIKFFSKYFVDKKYSFSGRNSTFSISAAKIKDCLGKIIIITNRYPTKTALDELINVSTNTLNNDFNLSEYKQSYLTYDTIGISQDNDKTTLLNNSKLNINFYYTFPDKSQKNTNQPKAGLFNPSFQDCAQYGIQGTLMYLFLPDDNLNKWNSFFANKNNLNPVLKDELLRSVQKKTKEIKEQNPVIGLQKSQKYCVIPGMISTEKSNLSGDAANSSC